MIRERWHLSYQMCWLLDSPIHASSKWWLYQIHSHVLLVFCFFKVWKMKSGNGREGSEADCVADVCEWEHASVQEAIRNEEKGNMKQFSYNVVRKFDFWCIERFPGFEDLHMKIKWDGKQSDPQLYQCIHFFNHFPYL